MRETRKHDDVYLSHARLALVVPSKKRTKLERHLDRFLPIGWRQAADVTIVEIEDRKAPNSRHASRRTRQRLFPRHLTYTIILVHPIDFTASALSDSQADIRKFSLKTLLDDKLELLVRQHKLHWTDNLLHKVSQWIAFGTSNITAEESISDWLAQFERIDANSKKWIGEKLLRALDVIDPQTVGDSFYEVMGGDLVREKAVSIFDYKTGGSCDVLNNLVRHKYNCDPVNFANALEQDEFPLRTVVTFEDGLFTGVEVEGILGALLGKRQKQGIVPLRNADQLCNRLIQLCFAVSSDLGEYRLRYALKQLGLNNVSIIVGRRFRVAVLTAAGEQACKNDTLLTNDKNGKTIIAAPQACITPVVFSDPTFWGSKEKLSEALGVCKQLGLQLFSNYLSRQGKLERWSGERIDECALGGGYLGLAFGFSFSIPKATLPVFWCGGPVEGRSSRFHWQPLFPNAE